MSNVMKYFNLFLVLFFATAIVFPQGNIVTTYETLEEKILVHYELNGDDSKEYDISLVVKRTSDKKFEYKPSNISGDVGKGKFATGKRTISWILSKKEIDLFSEGDDFYFEVGADLIKGGISWYYYVGGAVLAGGGAALFLLKPKTTSTTETLPTPPGRP